MRICPTCGNKFPDDANFCPEDASRLGEPIVAAAPVAARTSPDQPAAIGGRFVPIGPAEPVPTGTMTRARDTEGGGEVMLLVADARTLPTPAAADRALRELKQLAKVRSEHVLRVVEQGRTGDGHVFVASEAWGGQTLEALVREHGPLPLERARAIVLAVGDALAEAQKVGVIHRDLAPHNVLVDGDSVKVTGFGIAEAVDDKVMGAPAFLSPEQAEGKPVDQRSNIYSLGALLYYLVTGEPPFSGDAAAMVRQHLHAQAPLPSQLRVGLPADVDRVVLKALEKSGGRRHLTLRQLLNEVDTLGAAPPPRAPAVTPVSSPRPTPAAVVPTAKPFVAPSAPPVAAPAPVIAPAPAPVAAAPAAMPVASAPRPTPASSAAAPIAKQADKPSGPARTMMIFAPQQAAPAPAPVEGLKPRSPGAESRGETVGDDERTIAMPAAPMAGSRASGPVAIAPVSMMSPPPAAADDEFDAARTVATRNRPVAAPISPTATPSSPVRGVPTASASSATARRPVAELPDHGEPIPLSKPISDPVSAPIQAAPVTSPAVAVPMSAASPAPAPHVASPAPAPVPAIASAPVAAPPPAAPAPASSSAAATIVAQPAKPHVAPAPGGKKKGFRETAWFKRGELEEELAQKAAEMSQQDPLAGPSATEAVVDESTLTAEDRARLSLKTGRTEVMQAIKAPSAIGDRMSEEELLAEMAGSRKWLIPAGASIALAAISLAVWFFFFRH